MHTYACIYTCMHACMYVWHFVCFCVDVCSCLCKENTCSMWSLYRSCSLSQNFLTTRKTALTCAESSAAPASTSSVAAFAACMYVVLHASKTKGGVGTKGVREGGRRGPGRRVESSPKSDSELNTDTSTDIGIEMAHLIPSLISSSAFFKHQTAMCNASA